MRQPSPSEALQNRTARAAPGHARPESRSWWQQPRSLAEIADLINQIVDEKCEAERNLSRLARTQKELEVRLRSLEARLSEQKTDMAALSGAAERVTNDEARRIPDKDEARRRVEAAIRQRLMEQEIETRLQELQIAWKQERHEMRQQIALLQKELQTYRLTAGDF